MARATLVNALLVKILNDTASWDKASAEIISPKIYWAIFYGVTHIFFSIFGVPVCERQTNGAMDTFIILNFVLKNNEIFFRNILHFVQSTHASYEH